MSNETLIGVISDQEKRIKELESKLAEAETVIEFYADHRKHQGPSDLETSECRTFLMSGKVAREYLRHNKAR